jgi:hypothetical protein
MQDPSRRAAHGSRLVSRHNDDATAYTLHRLCTEAGLPVAATVHWNVVPWWAGDPLAVPREGLVAAVRRARPHLRTLLDLLPGPRVVVLLGRHAQRAWDAAGVDDGGRAVLRGPHPSPNATINRDRATGRPNLELLADTVRAAAAAAGAGGAPEADTDPR